MKKILLPFLILAGPSLFAQNLVPNPSFENTTPFCGIFGPTNFLTNITNWTIPNAGSPDICHASLPTSCPNTTVGSTNGQAWGSEPPVTGDAYAAIITYCSACAGETREYLQVQLTSPMIVGQTYTAQFYVSPGDYVNWHTNNLGMHFSVIPPTSTTWPSLPVTPQLNYSNTITNVNGWTLVSGTITPTAPFEYITIGNFFNDANTTIVPNASGNLIWAVYFVDDVSVSLTVPVMSVSGDSTICAGDSTVLTAVNSSTYGWATSTNPGNVFSTNASITVSPLVTTTYLVYGTTDTVSYTVNVLNAPVVSLGNDTILCQSQMVLLNAGNPGATYLWQNGTTAQTYAVQAPGTYYVAVTNSCGTATDSINVIYLAAPAVALGNDTTLCQGSSLTLNALFPGSSYLWQNGATTSGITVSQQGTYIVTVTNNCGTDRDTINVTFIQPPVVTLGNDTTLCQGSQLTLNAQFPGATYSWQNGSTASTYQVTQSGNYWVAVTNACGTANDTVSVVYIANPTVNLGADSSFCSGGSIVLDATGTGYTYLWQDGSTSSTLSVSQSGTYVVTVSNSCGSAIDSLQVMVYDLPVVNLGPDAALCTGDTLLLNATWQNATYIWQDGSTGSQFPVTASGIYYVTLLENGCSASDTVTVINEGCTVLINMPIVFSPNGDGINEVYGPIDFEGISSAKMLIYNRWGNLISETENLPEGWDGGDYPEGTYFWVVKYTDINDQSGILKGSLTLRR